MTQKSVVFDMPVRGCRTKDDVPVAVDAALAFRIMGDMSKASRKQARTVSPALNIFFVYPLGIYMSNCMKG